MTADEFALILLAFRAVTPRLQAAIARVAAIECGEYARYLHEIRPVVLATGLSLADAALGQFELACADAAAVFLRNEVILGGELEYLQQLFLELLASDEFRWVNVRVLTLPSDEHGMRFARQFLTLDGDPDELPLPMHQPAMLKKARAMVSWGHKIGARILIDPD